MDPARLPLGPHPIAPGSQTAWYLPWLKARVLIRAALTMPWSPEDWTEIRQHLKWLLKLQREARLLQLGLWRGTEPLPPVPGASATTPAQAGDTRPGVPPQDAWTCPLTHPIKGNFTTSCADPAGPLAGSAARTISPYPVVGEREGTTQKATTQKAIDNGLAPA
jgi:hypothetical protein